MMTIVFASVGAVSFVLYLMRRNSRLRREEE